MDNIRSSLDSALFIDRDGVLNKLINVNGELTSPKFLKDFYLFTEDIIHLNNLHERYLLILFTNQPDIARKKMERDDLKKMHIKLKEYVPFDDILICEHDDDDNCLCRKPKPGMILSAKNNWKINLEKSFVIGDTRKDIEAGKAVNVTTIFINRLNKNNIGANYTFNSIKELVNSKILN